MPCKPDFDCIPNEIKLLDRWCVWKDNKVPFIADIGWRGSPRKPWYSRRAKSNDPSTWRAFEKAKAAYEAGGVDGVGFFLGDGFAGFDLDKCALTTVMPAYRSVEIEDWAV